MPAKKRQKADALASFRIPRKLLDEIDRICEREDRPRSYILRKLVEEAVQARKKRS